MSAARPESTLATGASPKARTLLRDESATNTKARLNNAKFGRAGRIEVSSSRKFEDLKHFHPYQLRAHARNLRERYRVLVAVDPWGPGTFLQGCWCLNCFCLLRSVRAQLMVIWDERLCRTYPHYYADRHGNN